MRIIKYFSTLVAFSFLMTASVAMAQDPKKPGAKPAAKPAETTPAKAPAKVTGAPAKPDAKPAAAPAPKAEGSAPVTVGTAKKRDATPSHGNTRQPNVAGNELKLRQLAELVEDLKNKVTATKYRLQLLKEAMTSEKETLGGAKIQIVHENKMGGVYRLVRVRYFLDGKLVQTLSAGNTKDKAMLGKKSIKIFSDHISTGNKRLRVFITYQGNGYGVFSYVKKWKWEVHNTYSFNISAGKLHILKVIGKEKGGFTTPLAKRPQIKFQLVTKPLVSKSDKKSEKKSDSKKSK